MAHTQLFWRNTREKRECPQCNEAASILALVDAHEIIKSYKLSCGNCGHEAKDEGVGLFAIGETRGRD